MEQKVLGKFDILKSKTLKKELVEVPEWGGSVWVQEMTAEQRDKFDNWVVKRKDGEASGMRLRVLIATVVDEHGKSMFTDLDIPDLKNHSSRATTRLSEVGLRLSGMTEEAKAEEIKNSEAALSGDSSLGSVENLDSPILTDLSKN
jgi:hypothetical protein